jgi:hypothetical protein
MMERSVPFLQHAYQPYPSVRGMRRATLCRVRQTAAQIAPIGQAITRGGLVWSRVAGGVEPVHRAGSEMLTVMIFVWPGVRAACHSEYVRVPWVVTQRSW